MTLRLSKVVLIFSVAIYYALVVFNNITDSANYQFVRHVLAMDSTSPGNHQMWRALDSIAWQVAFYVLIVAWELATMICCGWGGYDLAKNLRSPAGEFHRRKPVAIVGLTLGLMMWFLAFLAVGGEWFLMWQSKLWNGQQAAFRMFTVLGIVLLFIAQPDSDAQP